MSDIVSFTERDGQYAELLPARTVLSMFAQGAPTISTGGNLVNSFLSFLQGNSYGAPGADASA